MGLDDEGVTSLPSTMRSYMLPGIMINDRAASMISW